MKNKKLLISMIAVLAVSIVIVTVALTYSWYSTKSTSDVEFEINANGFLVIVFDEDINYGDIPLKPAVAIPNAVRDGKYMDVLTPYNPDDTNPSFIKETATLAKYQALLRYYNEDVTLLPSSDLIFHVSAYILLPNGSEIEVDLERELSITLTATVDYDDPSLPSLSEVITPGKPYTVEGKAVVTLDLDAYVKQCDELCDPAFFYGLLRIRLGVSSNTAPNNP